MESGFALYKYEKWAYRTSAGLDLFLLHSFFVKCYFARPNHSRLSFLSSRNQVSAPKKAICTAMNRIDPPCAR